MRRKDCSFEWTVTCRSSRERQMTGSCWMWKTIQSLDALLSMYNGKYFYHKKCLVWIKKWRSKLINYHFSSRSDLRGWESCCAPPSLWSVPDVAFKTDPTLIWLIIIVSFFQGLLMMAVSVLMPLPGNQYDVLGFLSTGSVFLKLFAALMYRCTNNSVFSLVQMCKTVDLWKCLSSIAPGLSGLPIPLLVACCL